MKIRQKATYISAITATLLLFSGCGSSSSSGNSSPTGYYLDSAVSGVSYECGNEKGITDSEGRFQFQKGEKCTFSLAGIKLKELSADETAQLPDNAKVVETNPDVLVFLQSIDKDGDPANGIDIDSELLAVLTTALANYNSDDIPTDDDLTTVVETLEQGVDDFKGEVVTKEDALEHLAHTQESLLVDLLANKSLWLVGEEDDNPDHKIEVKFNEDLTIYTVGSRNYEITIDGDRFISTDSGIYDVVTEKDGYIELKEYSVDNKYRTTYRLYPTESEAAAYIQSLTVPLTQLQSLIIGHTYYIDVDTEPQEGIVGHIETLEFLEDGETLINTYVNPDTNESIESTFTYTFDAEGTTLSISGTTSDGDTIDITLTGDIEETAEYIKIGNDYFYITTDAALAAVDDDTTSDETTNDDSDEAFNNTFTTDYLNGKTLYFVSYNDFGYADMKWNMAKMTFNSDSYIWQEYDTADTDEHTFTYVVDNGSIVTENDDKFTAVDSNDTSIHLSVNSNENNYFFFDETTAKNYRDAQNNSYYKLQESDIAGYTIKVGNPSKDKEYHSDHTYTSLEENEEDRDTGTWSINDDGKLVHVWSSGNEEIHYFAVKPAIDVVLTNETYGASGRITAYFANGQ